MVKFLQKLSKRLPQDSVKYWLHQHLSGYRPGRSHRVVHASNMTSSDEFCPRYFALADATKMQTQDEWLSTSQAMTYQIGRDQERNIVLWFAEMGKAVCHWRCVGCKTRYDFQGRPPKCKECGCKAFDPEEVNMVSAVSGASAGLDMLVAVGSKKLRIVEIKTMDKEQFKELKAPLAEHRWRTNLYLRITSESEQPWARLVDTKKATILYTTKGGFGCADPEVKAWGLPEDFSPFKEYEVVRDDSLTDDIVNRARAVKLFREEVVGMPCGVCPTALIPRAKKCPLRGACFSGDYPQSYDWKKDPK